MKTIYASFFISLFIFANCASNKNKLDKHTVEVKVFNDHISYQYLYKTEIMTNGLTVETYEIKYQVDSLQITGYIHKPIGNQAKYPGKVYYRGNNRDRGNFGRHHLEEQRNIAADGFVVLSSQLRGNVFSQGTDDSEPGVLNDVLELVKIANCLSFVDTQNISVHDVSADASTKYKVNLIEKAIATRPAKCNKDCTTHFSNHKVTHEVFTPLISYQYLYKSNEVKGGLTVETYEIKYIVDGLMITGYINKPLGELHAYPALIYCRGGNRDLGTFGRKQLATQRNLAAEGFVVLSTQLRGNIFSQGTDEMGGADLNDILQLIQIAKSISFVRGEKIGIHGVSRGGRNAYQISRISDEISSVSVVGAPVDIRDSHSYRPEKYTRVNLPLIGDTIKFKHEYDKRSPIFWVDELNEPLLILHGKNDWRTKVENVKRIIPELEKYNKEFEYHFIEEGSHTLGTHRKLRDSLVTQWHMRFLK